MGTARAGVSSARHDRSHRRPRGLADRAHTRSLIALVAGSVAPRLRRSSGAPALKLVRRQLALVVLDLLDAEPASPARLSHRLDRFRVSTSIGAYAFTVDAASRVRGCQAACPLVRRLGALFVLVIIVPVPGSPWPAVVNARPSGSGEAVRAEKPFLVAPRGRNVKPALRHDAAVPAPVSGTLSHAGSSVPNSRRAWNA
jgi:hypothetical protein